MHSHACPVSAPAAPPGAIHGRRPAGGPYGDTSTSPGHSRAPRGHEPEAGLRRSRRRTSLQRREERRSDRHRGLEPELNSRSPVTGLSQPRVRYGGSCCPGRLRWRRMSRPPARTARGVSQEQLARSDRKPDGPDEFLTGDLPATRQSRKWRARTRTAASGVRGAQSLGRAWIVSWEDDQAWIALRELPDHLGCPVEPGLIANARNPTRLEQPELVGQVAD